MDLPQRFSALIMYPVISQSIFSKRISCCGEILLVFVHIRVSRASLSAIFDFVMSSVRCVLYCISLTGDVDISVRCWGTVRSLLCDCRDFWHRSMMRQRWSPGKLSSHDSMLAEIVASRKKYVPIM